MTIYHGDGGDDELLKRLRVAAIKCTDFQNARIERLRDENGQLRVALDAAIKFVPLWSRLREAVRTVAVPSAGKSLCR